MGPTRTLPPDHQRPPRTPRQRVDDPLELDQPPTVLSKPSIPPDLASVRAVAMDDTGEHLDVGMGPLEPLGRRSPQPLEASREAVER